MTADPSVAEASGAMVRIDDPVSAPGSDDAPEGMAGTMTVGIPGVEGADWSGCSMLVAGVIASPRWAVGAIVATNMAARIVRET